MSSSETGITVPDLFLGDQAAQSRLITITKPGLDFPLGWIRTAHNSDGVRSIAYEVLETQNLKIPGGKSVVMPKKSVIRFSIDGDPMTQTTFSVTKLEFNDPAIEVSIEFDPSSASLIEDVDAGTLITVPK